MIYVIAVLIIASEWMLAKRVDFVNFAAGVAIGLLVAGKFGHSLAVRRNGMDMMRTGGRRLRRGKF